MIQQQETYDIASSVLWAYQDGNNGSTNLQHNIKTRENIVSITAQLQQLQNACLSSVGKIKASKFSFYGVLLNIIPAINAHVLCISKPNSYHLATSYHTYYNNATTSSLQNKFVKAEYEKLKCVENDPEKEKCMDLCCSY